MTTIKQFIQQKAAQCNNYLTKTMPSLPHLTEVLEESMRYSLLDGGKRLRPVLLLTTMECFQVNSEKGLPFAAALEYIHCYSLIHDDLPAMDDDELRRGKPTNHIKFGEDIALLAGDALLTHAFSMISQEHILKDFPAENIIKSIHLLSHYAGIFGMVGGQCADIKADDHMEDPSLLDFIHAHKTGALITGSIEMGAVLSGADKSRVELLKNFGKSIGKCFQIQDDILDETGTTEELGKPAGSDAKNQKLTYPSLYGLDRSKEMAKEEYDKAISFLDCLQEDTTRLKEIAAYIIERNQ